MSDYLDGLDLDALDGDIGTDDVDRKRVGSSGKDDWFKPEKRGYRVSLVYFQPIEMAMATAFRRQKPQATLEQIKAAVSDAMLKRADKLGKPVSEMNLVERTAMDSVQFKTCMAYYKEGFGYAGVDPHASKDDHRFFAAKLGECKTYVTTALLFYPTDRDGNPSKDPENLLNNWFIKKWRFSSKMYDKLCKLASGLKDNDLSLAGQDLLLTCTNDKFQQFDVSVAGKALYRKDKLKDALVEYDDTKVKFQDAVLMAAAKACGDLGKDLYPFRVMTVDMVKEKLGIVVEGSNSTPDFSEAGAADLLANL